MVEHITPADLSKRLSDPELQLIDVREEIEHQICRIEGSRLIPMRRLISGGDLELDPSREVVVYCHHGSRSLQTALYLKRRGFERVFNLAGGINAWSRDVDPSVPRY
jgi:rhodanese-related sulfurtransferase